MLLLDLRDEDPGVLSAIGKDIHTVHISSFGRAQERRQRAHLVRMAPTPGRDQLELIFRCLRLIVDELLEHGREIAAGRDGQEDRKSVV